MVARNILGKIVHLLIVIPLMGCVPSKGKLDFSYDRLGRETFPVSGNARFVQLQSKILIPKCLECHRWVNDEQKVQRFVSPGKPEESLLFEILESGEMPEEAPPLSTAELELVREYINSVVVN